MKKEIVFTAAMMVLGAVIGLAAVWTLTAIAIPNKKEINIGTIGIAVKN
jgi:hypothetical protein